MKSTIQLVFILLAPLVLADSNGMDMSMDGPMSLAAGRMVPYLHFTPGDNLWFLGWVPQSAGAMVGACIGLALLALVERWIAACRAVMEAHWNRRARIIISNRLNARLPTDSETKSIPTLHTPLLRMRHTLPFIASHDIPRGLMHMVQASLGFAFMLVVMTFQVGFIISVVVGLGVGEMLFGRYSSAAVHLG